MYRCDSWTIKTAEHRRIDTFELWCWRRLLRIPWTARRSNESILKEISTEYSLEGLMLKLQYFGCEVLQHLMRRTDSLGKTLMLRKIEGRRRGWQRMRWLDGTTDLMDMSLSKLGCWWWTGRPGLLWSMGSQRVGHNWATEWNWTESPAPRLHYWFLAAPPLSLHPLPSLISNTGTSPLELSEGHGGWSLFPTNGKGRT